MATARSPELARATAVFLLAVAGALQTLAGALAFPEWLFLSLLGLGGPILIALLALRAQAPVAGRLVMFFAELSALLALAAVVFAVMSPSTAGGLLVLLWLSWLGVLPAFVWLTRAKVPLGRRAAARPHRVEAHPRGRQARRVARNAVRGVLLPEE